MARRTDVPGFIKPQLATLKSKAPTGAQWLHEIKYDGYRVQVHVNAGREKVFTRNGLDWTKRFSTIAGALDISGQAIIDGEVVVVHEGRTDFSELQAELANNRSAGTADENRAVVGGSIALFGTYTVDEDKKLVIFTVKASTFPNWDGAVPPRKIVLLNESEFINENTGGSVGGGAVAQNKYSRAK